MADQVWMHKQHSNAVQHTHTTHTQTHAHATVGCVHFNDNIVTTYDVQAAGRTHGADQ